MTNLFEPPATHLPEEFMEIIASDPNVRIERIVSTGHCSPQDFWYDQDEHEWVALLAGAAQIELAEGETVELKPGDHLLIPAHQRHRVAWTTPHEPTIWLAVFTRNDEWHPPSR